MILYIRCSVQNYWPPIQRNKLSLIMKKGLEELDQYKLSRSQYAKKLGITPNAVRMRMRHGKLNGEYYRIFWDK